LKRFELRFENVEFPPDLFYFSFLFIVCHKVMVLTHPERSIKEKVFRISQSCEAGSFPAS
jgi:hypothetical protein